MESKLTIIIPAYNEADALPAVLPSLVLNCKEKGWKIIIVNDGSADDTKKVLQAFQSEEILSVIHHKVNRGYGGAIKTGILACNTELCATFDADGQHSFQSLVTLFQKMNETDADLVIGNRIGRSSSGLFRETGKYIIRKLANFLIPLHISDINSGLKLYRTDLAKRYLPLCPNSMAYSDIISLIFVSQKHLVLEHPIEVSHRIAGESTIGVKTAFQTVIEIINILMLFNPLRLFLPLSILFAIVTTIWEIPLLLKGNGLSVGSLFGYIVAFIIFLLGLIAEQLGLIRKLIIYKND